MNNNIINNIYNNFINNKLIIKLLNINNLHDKIFILNKLLEMCNNQTIYFNNYKKLYYYSLYNYIIYNINNIIELEIKDDFDDQIEFIIKKLILKLISLYKGHLLLQKLNINKYLKLNNYNSNYLLCAATIGNITTFNYWLNKVDLNLLSIDFKEELIIKSVINSDYRILINLLYYFNKNNLLDNNILIHRLINKISINKKKLHKINIILKYIDINIYYYKLVSSFNDIEIFKNLNKYYKKTHEFTLLKIIYENYNLYNKNYYNQIKQELKTVKEIKLLNIIDNLININSSEEIVINTEVINYIIKCSNNILLLIIEYYYIFTEKKNILLNVIINNNLINQFIYNNSKLIIILQNFFNFFLYTRFFNINKILTINYIYYNKIILLNKFLHKLRLKLKYKYNNRIMNYYFNKVKILNEIVTYKPFKNFINGSLYYQNIIYYNQFYFNYKEENIYYFVPYNIYPHTNLFNKYPIITKYIEKNELYLIYDILIPNFSQIEKFNLLSKLHPKFNSFTNFESFILENNYIKWYPCIKNI